MVPLSLPTITAPGAGQLILVTGPSRSGKSDWAEHLARQTGKAVIYIATAQRDPTDPEWSQRIDRHCLRRPPDWQTLEVPLELGAALQAGYGQPSPACMLVDSLGTWVTNHLETPDRNWEQTVNTLVEILQTPGTDVILVAEEVGWSVVPAYPLGRRFRDRLGQLVRQIGGFADLVYLVTGGYALNLTVLGTPLPSLELESPAPDFPGG